MKKNALITGAAGGLGTAVTQSFLDAGYRVTALVEPGKPQQAEHLKKVTGSPEALDIQPVDAMDGDAVAAFIKEKYESQPLHAALLLVGGFAMGGLEKTDEGALDKMIQLNFKTAFHFSRHVLPIMAEGGGIVLMGARPALEPAAATSMLAYSISKGMVLQLADIINESEKKRNIQAAVVLPSIIDTPANRAGMPNADFEKWVRPEEIAEAMLYTCSTAAGKLMAPVLKMYGRA